jgi:OOP family OmpA-OmpF porin
MGPYNETESVIKGAARISKQEDFLSETLHPKEVTQMKKIVSFMVLLAVFVLTGVGHAGERAGAFSVSPFVGGYVFDDAQPVKEHRMVYGGRLGYDWTDSFATELVLDYVRAELKNEDKHLDAYFYHLDFLYNLMPHSRVVPYLAVGGGGQTLRFWHNDSTDPIFNAGGGVKFFVADSVALRLDGRYLLDFAGNDQTRHNWQYTAGVSFLFGGHKPAAAAMEAAPPPAPEAAPPAEAPVEPAPAAEPTAGHYKYCVTLHGEFDIDKADIRPENREEIAKVGNFMKKYPTTTAVIEGHTDNVGTYNHNMDLSQRRAESVVNYLVENFGIDRSRLVAKGYGFTRPVADNSTDEGRQKNRRIEAVIDCAFDVQKIEPPEKLCMTLVIDFDSGKADIKPIYNNEIAKVADYMKQYPTTTAVIEGHTDNVGDPAANMKLSQQRAENVVNALVQNFGIDRSRLSAKGYGDTRRISYNNTAEGRAKNRRINAIIDCVIKR